MTEVISDDDSDYQDITTENDGRCEEIQPSAPFQYQDEEYKVVIEKGGNEIQLKILQNQFYSVTLLRKNEIFRNKVQRRFSDFALFFDSLYKKNKGFIFPAFPQNGLFSYVKSKVSVAKDQFFIARRIKMIERFFNILLTYNEFNPQKNSVVNGFFIDSAFQHIKKLQKQKASITDGLSWNKLINYFYTSSPKETQSLEQLNKYKRQFQAESHRFREICQLLKEQQAVTAKILQQNLTIMEIEQFSALLLDCVNKQKKNLQQAEQNQFQSSCLCEDINMVRKILEQVQQLKNKEQNYKQVRLIQDSIKKQFPLFKEKKRFALLHLQRQYQRILKEISFSGRPSTV